MARISVNNLKLVPQFETSNNLEVSESYSNTFISGKNYHFSAMQNAHTLVDVILGFKKAQGGEVKSVPQKLSYAFIGFYDGSEFSKLKSWFSQYSKQTVFDILQKYCPKDILKSILEDDLSTDILKTWVQCLDVIFKQTDVLILKDQQIAPYNILRDYPAVKIFV